jgi:hypothetical protein
MLYWSTDGHPMVIKEAQDDGKLAQAIMVKRLLYRKNQPYNNRIRHFPKLQAGKRDEASKSKTASYPTTRGSLTDKRWKTNITKNIHRPGPIAFGRNSPLPNPQWHQKESSNG